MRTGLLATGFLALSGYAIWTLVWNAFSYPEPLTRDSSEYVLAVGGCAWVSLVALWLGYRLGRRIHAGVRPVSPR